MNTYVKKEKPVKNAEAGQPQLDDNAVIGRNAVKELLNSDREINKILVQKGERNGSIVMLFAMAKEKGIPIVETEKSKMDALSGFVPHQGIIAYASETEYCSIEDILQIAKDKQEDPVVVICDGVTDPYNLGAIIRVAECCGAHGVIIPKRRAVGVTPLVAKASAGALSHMAIARVSNINSAIDKLKENGVWIYGAEAGGSSIYDTSFKGPVGIVMGSEGNGISQSVKKSCDAIVSIPMYGLVNSFNVSTASAVILAKVAKDHH